MENKWQSTRPFETVNSQGNIIFLSKFKAFSNRKIAVHLSRERNHDEKPEQHELIEF